MTRKEVERTFLTEDELQLLRVKVLATDRLNQVRDIFLFCCFTGLAYADVKKLQRSEICIGIDGDRWIFTSRQKTESPSRIPLLPFASDIIDHYKDEPTCMQKGRVLPVPSNQKVNAYLKDLKRVPKESLAECQTQSQGEGKNQQQKTKESTGQKQKNGESLQLPKKKGKINLEISLTKNMAMN